MFAWDSRSISLNSRCGGRRQGMQSITTNSLYKAVPIIRNRKPSTKIQVKSNPQEQRKIHGNELLQLFYGWFSRGFITFGSVWRNKETNLSRVFGKSLGIVLSAYEVPTPSLLKLIHCCFLHTHKKKPTLTVESSSQFLAPPLGTLKGTPAVKNISGQKIP